MKRLLVCCLLLLSSAALAVNDHDGDLKIQWVAPTGGNPLDHYEWSYDINGVVDSVTGTSSGTFDNSVVLADVGDYAVFRIRSISTIGDVSNYAVSDTVYFDTELGINPPSGLMWIQD